MAGLKGIGKAIEDFSDMINRSIHNFNNSGAASKISEKVTKGAIKVGKTGFNIGLKGASAGLSATANTVDHFRQNKDIYKRIGKSMAKFGGDTVKEGNEIVQAGFGAVELLERTGILQNTKGDFSKSMIGYKLSPGAKLGLLPVGLLAGSVGATKDYMTSREGRNDGRTYRPTPSMTNPYDLSQSLAYSKSGRSYDDNAGADSDLIRSIW